MEEGNTPRFGTVCVKTDRGSLVGERATEFTDARFTVDGPVNVFNKSGDLVGYFPHVCAVTFAPNEEA